jgi:hypothetical protein
MRRSARILVVSIAVALMTTFSPCQQTSSVITSQAPVYSQASTRSRVLQTLQQGQRVFIDMTISNSEGTWCLIREPESKEKPGYIPCAQLTSDALPKAVLTVPVFDSPTNATSAATGSPGSNARHDALGLTEAQTAEIQRFKEAYGIEALRDDAVRAYRRYGVTDDFSALNRAAAAGKRPYSDSFFATMEPKIRRGAVQYKAYWKAYWNILTKQQREAIAKSNPGFILAYVFSQSDPESAFNAYVLSELRRTSKPK